VNNLPKTRPDATENLNFGVESAFFLNFAKRLLMPPSAQTRSPHPKSPDVMHREMP
jgi:hypothetical protein